MDNRPIGVFDSGLGGLTAVKELKRVLPNESIIYFGDTGRIPYGTRSRETIIKYAKQDMKFLMQYNVKAIVAACGTVSSTASKIGNALPVPYIDVIGPTAKAAAEATKTGRIGVLGTSATINSGSFYNALKQINRDFEVFTEPCPLFVNLVENGFVSPGDEVTQLAAQRYLAAMKADDVDTIILGCTHFPIIKWAIGAAVGEKVKLIDSGRETARHLAKVLEEKNLLAQDNAEPEYRYCVSDSVQGFRNVAELFLGGAIDGDIVRIDIERY
ncbi:MAG: glutamate racemase [Clostridia bacterium]|nr:glutamate racemase [Clostridia bacterium]